MQEFLRFLDEHSEYDLVTSFKEGRWCLGDWCTPVKWTLPTPFVNTYFRVWTTEKVIEIARLIGREEDIPKMQADIARCKKAINTVYFNAFERDDTFLANAQGAAAFALGIGLGTENTKQKFIDYYDELGYYDTGIFATELVTRRLFELGRADVAFKLLTAEEPHGFGRWRKIGSTTLREYWGEVCRSYSHPMFGAVVATFFEYILGIKQTPDSAGYKRVVISPEYIASLDSAKGHIKTPLGRVGVEYTTKDGKRTYKVTVPKGMEATFVTRGKESRVLCEGENVITEAL
jgi:alpha-L-rhamnosidase